MTKTSKRIRCAIYDRVSTDMQVKDGLSLDAQREALTAYAVIHGYEIVGVYSDEGLTARKKLQNRKNLIRLLNDVKADKIDLILVARLDRWFRNVKDYHNTQAILEAHGCNWKTIYEEYDTTTSNGRFAINIMLSVNENECDRDSERIRSVFEYKKLQKQNLCGKPAYGYKMDAQKHLVKDPATKHIVEDIFDHYFTTFSKKETISYILSKYGNLAPTMYQVNRILSSDVYTGKKYGIPDYCEAYITPDQFRKIAETSDSKIIPHQTEPFLFSSMIRCPICGKFMSGFVKRQYLKNGEKSEYKRYRCSAKFVEYHNGACISESVIEQYLLDHIVEQLSYDMMEAKKKEQSAPLNRSRGIRQEIDRLNHMYQKGRISDAYYDEQYNALNERLQNALASENIVSIEAYRPICDLLSDSWQDVYRELDAVHKKAFWRSIIKEIHVDPETRKISGFRLNA